jgi:hypothetical protein
MGKKTVRPGWAGLPLLLLIQVGCAGSSAVPDEAKTQLPGGGAHATVDDLEAYALAHYQPATHDYFKDMDCVRGRRGKEGPKRLQLDPEEVKGRNAWVLWAGGNQAFWDWIARHGYASVDLLKIIDSQERGKRFAKAGLLTEPDMRPPTKEETEKAFGVRYDRPDNAHVEREHPPKYEIYGYPSGIVGLRLFKNPAFFNSPTAQARWDAARYYQNLEYASRPDTIRPFRVGMSCGFCHIAPHPLNPPADPEAPEWENLSNNVGNQYMRFRWVFGNTLEPHNLLYHVINAQMPGTIDTSLVASDNINNANTINAFYGLNARVTRAAHNPKEMIGADTLAYLQAIGQAPAQNPDFVPRVLLDGADSVGVHLALARVYLNIGTYHEQWVRLHNPLLGFRKQAPFKVKDCNENSVYWHATRLRVEPLFRFFLKSTDPQRLKDAAWGDKPRKLKGDGDTMHADHRAGRRTFARGCIACHSSIQPGDSPDLEVKLLTSARQEGKEPDGKARETKSPALGLGKAPADWDTLSAEAKARFVEPRGRLRLRLEDLTRLTRGDGSLPPDYLEWSQAAVEQPEFWKENYLSTDTRIPVTLTRTNSARAMATNGLHGQMWDDFSSQTYKELDPVGRITYRDPFSSAERSYEAPGGGRGYYRVPTLISIWATAPLLHNNALGKFNNDPSVEGRLAAFDDAARKLFWPEKRLRVTTADLSDQYALHQHLWPPDALKGRPKTYASLSPQEKEDVVKAVNAQLAQDGGLVWRTSEESWLMIHGHQIPSLTAGLTGWPPFWVGLLPWLPTIVLVLLGVLLLLSRPLIRFRQHVERRVPLLEWLLAPLRWLVAVGGLVLAVLSLLVILEHWSVIRVFDVATERSILLLRTQAVLVPAAFFLSAAVLFLLPRIPVGWLSRKLAYFFGAVCLSLAALVGLSFGQFFAGDGGDVRFGPIPKGVPVNVVANMDPQAPLEKRLAALNALVDFVLDYQRAKEGSKPGQREFEARVAPALMEASRCPDFVMDRGHDYEFMRRLSDDERQALIELLKTF